MEACLGADALAGASDNNDLAGHGERRRSRVDGRILVPMRPLRELRRRHEIVGGERVHLDYSFLDLA